MTRDELLKELHDIDAELRCAAKHVAHARARNCQSNTEISAGYLNAKRIAWKRISSSPSERHPATAPADNRRIAMTLKTFAPDPFVATAIFGSAAFDEPEAIDSDNPAGDDDADYATLQEPFDLFFDRAALNGWT